MATAWKVYDKLGRFLGSVVLSKRDCVRNHTAPLRIFVTESVLTVVEIFPGVAEELHDILSGPYDLDDALLDVRHVISSRYVFFFL